MPSFTKKRVPLIYLAGAVLVGVCGTLGFGYLKDQSSNGNPGVNAVASTVHSDVRLIRLKGLNYISPLLYAEEPQKDAKFGSLDQQIAAYIEAKKQSKDLNDAAFYLKDMQEGGWTGVNEDNKFLPGSLMKIPVLISYLRMEENTPGLLDKQFFYEKPFDTRLSPTILSKQLEPGKSYTIRELLKYMIAYSDNNAASLLDAHLLETDFFATLRDLGLPVPKPGATSYPVSAKEYSLLLRAIYNSSYLSIAHSEFAAKLLSECDYKGGFVKGFPPSVKLIHKFGESGTQEEHQFSESGVVYINDRAYVLTIMTKGTNLEKLPSVVSDMAAIVYQQVNH